MLQDAAIPQKSKKKKLIIRLSSLGDVILATSALEVARMRGEKWDWLVAVEYGDVLRGHPALGKLWLFDRKSGRAGWTKLCREILESGDYDEVFDLHRTLRSRIFARVARSVVGAPPIRRVSKSRWQLYGYFFFKALWPKVFRPSPWVRRYSLAVGGTGAERPDLRHLLEGTSNPVSEKNYLCVMPSSKWDGKKWPVEKFVRFLSENRKSVPVILGGNGDRESYELVEALQRASIPFISGVGKWNLTQVAKVLAGSRGYLGNDTGIAHLAEAVGAPANLIFGPTTPGMGFGPWRPESRAISAGLWCSPCGKDGRFCFRFDRPYSCLRDLEPDQVLSAMKGSAQ